MAIVTHGETGTRLYIIWRNMRKRVLNPKDREYKNYGGRGISICPEWLTFEGFLQWAISTNYQEHLTIERRDVHGNYEPGNCYWADMSTQQANKRKRKGTKYRYTGIHQLPTGKWRVVAQFKGKKLMDRAIYQTEDDALKARNDFVRENNLPHLIQ